MALSADLPWITTAFAGVVAALAYFIARMVQERRFYKDMVRYVLAIAVILINFRSPSHRTTGFGVT